MNCGLLRLSGWGPACVMKVTENVPATAALLRFLTVQAGPGAGQPCTDSLPGGAVSALSTLLLQLGFSMRKLDLFFRERQPSQS